MRARKLLVLGLVVVLAIGALAVTGCGGGSSQAKADLSAALDKVEASMAQLTTKFTQGGTVPELKTAKDQIASQWQAVIDAAKKVKGADVTAAQNAWTAVNDAVNSLADSTPLVQAAATILGPIQQLQKVIADLRKLAPSTSTTAGGSSSSS